MAAALECWSGRTSTDEEVLMLSQHRSESSPENTPSAATSVVQKKLQRLGRNVSEAISSLKNSLNLDSGTVPRGMDGRRKVAWGSVVRNLTQMYPGSQLPEKMMANIRKHFDSLPLSYAQAGFDMKDVFMHIKLVEQAAVDGQPAIMIQEVSDNEIQGSIFKLTFACNSSVSWPSMSGALDNASICCKKLQIFEKKGSTLGIILILVQSGQEKMFKTRIENALKSVLKKPRSTAMKLPFGLCGCQEGNTKWVDMGEIEEDYSENNYRDGVNNNDGKIQIQMPLPDSSLLVVVDEWQTVESGRDEIGKWLISTESIEISAQNGLGICKGIYKGKRVGIEKLKGCDKGNAYEFVIRKNLLELMTCGHKNILQFYGVAIDDSHGLCIVSKYMEGGSVHDLMVKNKKLQMKEILRIASDVAEGIKFMNDHGVAFRDLNTQRILLDRHGNACLGMGIVSANKSCGEAMDYETDGYRWLAPEIISADPESVTETWMSNVYSFGMVVWEMVAGELAYTALSPVQAAVGIAACGLRPDIPKDCPQILSSLMIKCWNNCPSKRPPFSEIISILSSINNCR